MLKPARTISFFAEVGILWKSFGGTCCPPMDSSVACLCVSVCWYLMDSYDNSLWKFLFFFVWYLIPSLIPCYSFCDRKESRLVHLTRHSPWLAGPLVKKVSLSLLALSSFGAVLPHCGIGQSWILVKHLDFLISIDSICQRLPTKAKIAKRCQKHANNAGNYCTVSFHIVPVQSFPSNN